MNWIWRRIWGKVQGVFHDFTFSGVLSLSVRASDERAQATSSMSLRWFPDSPVGSGPQWSSEKEAIFPPESLFINNKHSWVAVTHLEANHSDFACRTEVSPLRSRFHPRRNSQGCLVCSNTILIGDRKSCDFSHQLPLRMPPFSYTHLDYFCLSPSNLELLRGSVLSFPLPKVLPNCSQLEAVFGTEQK